MWITRLLINQIKIKINLIVCNFFFFVSYRNRCKKDIKQILFRSPLITFFY